MLKTLQNQYIHQGIEGYSNHAALYFYLKYGFITIDERAHYLRWGPQR